MYNLNLIYIYFIEYREIKVLQIDDMACTILHGP